MSTYTLTPASEGALRRLALACQPGGTDHLLLIAPARELTAQVSIEHAAQPYQLQATVELGSQRHSMTLQRDDSANTQHLADWVEAIANGTLDTAEAILQRSAAAKLLPCCKCGSEAIGYDYAISGSEFRNGVKCRHRDCQSVEGAKTPEAAHEAWNAIQREDLDEQPDAATDMVNHPPHYTGHPSGVECIEVAEHLPFCLGNAFKYLFRRDAKGNPLENIEKAIWYVNRHNETYPEKTALPDEARHALGQIVVHEPYPFAQAMLLIAGPEQCGGYDNCLLMLLEEAQRLRGGAKPRLAA